MPVGERSWKPGQPGLDLYPVLMARPSLPLHPGARRYYSDTGYLS
jgi:TRAP-type uncharacterized transport system substrate-binding protein